MGQLCCSIERKLAAKQPAQTCQVCQARQRHDCRSLYTFNVSCYLRTKMGRLPQTKAGFIASKYEIFLPSLHASSYTYDAARTINRIVAGDKWSFCGSRHIWDTLACRMGIGKLWSLKNLLAAEHSTCLLVNARQADYLESAQGRRLPRRTASRCSGSLLPGTPRWPVHLFILEGWACLTPAVYLYRNPSLCYHACLKMPGTSFDRFLTVHDVGRVEVHISVQKPWEQYQSHLQRLLPDEICARELW